MNKRHNRVFIVVFTALIFLAGGRAIHAAAFEETDASYYGRMMKSCEYKTRETWRDYLLYAPNKRLDECCAESVRAMAKQGAKPAPSNRQCPDGTQINALKCTSSKSWCEKVK